MNGSVHAATRQAGSAPASGTSLLSVTSLGTGSQCKRLRRGDVERFVTLVEFCIVLVVKDRGVLGNRSGYPKIVDVEGVFLVR